MGTYMNSGMNKKQLADFFIENKQNYSSVQYMLTETYGIMGFAFAFNIYVSDKKVFYSLAEKILNNN
jgi:uncharacterized protein YcgL (UPF0745 family)